MNRVATLIGVVLAVVLLSTQAQTEQAQSPVTLLPERLIVTGDLDPWSRETEELGRYVASLLEADPHIRVVVNGDVCNPRDFHGGTQECYDQLAKTAWGPIMPLLYVVPGNHDYEQVKCTDGIPVIFNQAFQIGERGFGYQVFDWGGWGNFLLNSEIMCNRIVEGRNELNGRGVTQLEWLERELKARSNRRCTLTIYHRPMYSSGRHPSPAYVRDLYAASIGNGVDLVIWSHEHFFVEFPLLWPVSELAAVVDVRRGIKHFGVGTGGGRPFPHPTVDHGLRKEDRKLKFEEVILTHVVGALELRLWPSRYSWQFLPIPSQRGQKASWPSGAGVCR